MVFKVFTVFFIVIFISAPSFGEDLKGASPEKAALSEEACKEGKKLDITIKDLVYHNPEDWIVWINGQKVTPRVSMKEIVAIHVRPDKVHLKWFDICSNYVFDFSLPVPSSIRLCKSVDDCKDFCKGAGNGKECLPDGVPVCSGNVCGCSLTCR